MNMQTRSGAAGANESRELTPAEVRRVSGGIAESPPPVHDTLVRPGDTKGVAL
jgi:hypothetical protein